MGGVDCIGGGVVFVLYDGHLVFHVVPYVCYCWAGEESVRDVGSHMLSASTAVWGCGRSSGGGVGCVSLIEDVYEHG